MFLHNKENSTLLVERDISTWKSIWFLIGNTKERYSAEKRDSTSEINYHLPLAATPPSLFQWSSL